MTRYIVTATKSRVIFRRITKQSRPLALVYDRLYRTDDTLAFSNGESEDSIIYYDLDEQQPYGHGDYLDPEYTKALIDSMKLGRGKLNRVVDVNFELIMALVVVGIVVWSIASQYLG